MATVRHEIMRFLGGEDGVVLLDFGPASGETAGRFVDAEDQTVAVIMAPRGRFGTDWQEARFRAEAERYARHYNGSAGSVAEPSSGSSGRAATRGSTGA
jgi:hypothetical protein